MRPCNCESETWAAELRSGRGSDPLVSNWKDEEDPDWPMSEWKDDVAAGNTRLGYFEWVEHNKESEDA